MRSIRVRWTLAGWAIAGLLAARLIPIHLVESMRSICLFKLTLDWECPGCGMTRALFHLLHLDIVGACHHNKLSLVVAPLLVTALLRKIISARPTTVTHFLPQTQATPPPPANSPPQSHYVSPTQ